MVSRLEGCRAPHRSSGCSCPREVSSVNAWPSYCFVQLLLKVLTVIASGLVPVNRGGDGQRCHERWIASQSWVAVRADRAATLGDKESLASEGQVDG